MANFEIQSGAGYQFFCSLAQENIIVPIFLLQKVDFFWPEPDPIKILSLVCDYEIERFDWIKNM